MDALTLLPSQTALFIVDVQEKLIPAMHAPDAKRMVACVELLVEAAQRFRMPVIVTEHYPQGLGRTLPSIVTLFESFETKPLVVEKTIFSAMGPTEVPRALAATGVRSVIAVGVEAHVCLFQTARELARRGYHTHVPFDAVASRDPACKATALALLGQHGVSVTTTETAVFDLLGDARNEHFKALSKRIKTLVG
jgi:nicotinamidase-related amidase